MISAAIDTVSAYARKARPAPARQASIVNRKDRIAAAGIRTLPVKIAAVHTLRVPSDTSLAFMAPITGSTRARAQSSKQTFIHQYPGDRLAAAIHATSMT